MVGQWVEAFGPLWEMAQAYPAAAGPLVVLVLMVAIASSMLTGAWTAAKFIAGMPKEGADTLRFRAEAARAEAEAQKYRAEAAQIEAESSGEAIERLSEQVDRLKHENDRLIVEGDKVLERLGACQRTQHALRLEIQQMGDQFRADMAVLNEERRLMAEWIEGRGEDLRAILGGRVS